MEVQEQLSNIKKIDEEKLPQIIADQFKEVDAIKNQIQTARKKAEDAKKKSENLRKVGKFGGGKKQAIEDLQESTKMMAKAQEQTTIAQGLFFDYQEKIANATKWIFDVCVNNAANTQTVIRQLKIYMEGGSADDLDELKQNEINAVINQLLQQESLQQKQEKMWDQIDSMELEIAEKSEKDRHQDEEIARQAEVDTELGKRIDASEAKDKSQDKEIARQAEVDTELGKRIDAGEAKDKSQDEEIARQAAMDAELGKRIDAGVEKDKNQDEEIARQAAIDEELAKHISRLMESNLEKESQIRELKSICEKLSKSIFDNASIVDDKEMGLLDRISEKASKKAVIVSYIIGLAGVIAAIVQFFI